MTRTAGPTSATTGTATPSSSRRPSYTRYYDWDGRDMMVRRPVHRAGMDGQRVPLRRHGVEGEHAGVHGLQLLRLGRDQRRPGEDGRGDGDRPAGARLCADLQRGGHRPDGRRARPCARADQVGTVWKVASAAESANSYQYDAFGVARSASETFANPFRFAGKHLDRDPEPCQSSAGDIRCPKQEARSPKGARCQRYLCLRPSVSDQRVRSPSARRPVGRRPSLRGRSTVISGTWRKPMSRWPNASGFVTSANGS